MFGLFRFAEWLFGQGAENVYSQPGNIAGVSSGSTNTSAVIAGLGLCAASVVCNSSTSATARGEDRASGSANGIAASSAHITAVALIAGVITGSAVAEAAVSTVNFATCIAICTGDITGLARLKGSVHFKDYQRQGIKALGKMKAHPRHTTSITLNNRRHSVMVIV